MLHFLLEVSYSLLDGLALEPNELQPQPHEPVGPVFQPIDIVDDVLVVEVDAASGTLLLHRYKWKWLKHWLIFWGRIGITGRRPSWPNREWERFP